MFECSFSLPKWYICNGDSIPFVWCSLARWKLYLPFIRLTSFRTCMLFKVLKKLILYATLKYICSFLIAFEFKFQPSRAHHSSIRRGFSKHLIILISILIILPLCSCSMKMWGNRKWKQLLKSKVELWREGKKFINHKIMYRSLSFLWRVWWMCEKENFSSLCTFHCEMKNIFFSLIYMISRKMLRFNYGVYVNVASFFSQYTEICL